MRLWRGAGDGTRPSPGTGHARLLGEQAKEGPYVLFATLDLLERGNVGQTVLRIVECLFWRLLAEQGCLHFLMEDLIEPN